MRFPAPNTLKSVYPNTTADSRGPEIRIEIKYILQKALMVAKICPMFFARFRAPTLFLALHSRYKKVGPIPPEQG